MRERRHQIGALQIDFGADRRVLKNSVLTMLGIWIAYFLVINTFIQQLDRIEVPLLDVPLGMLLAMQGGGLLFLTALYLLARVRHSER